MKKVGVPLRVIAAALLAASLTGSPTAGAEGDAPAAGNVAQARTAAAFAAMSGDPQAQIAFLAAMPKGGDLHSHPAGAEYAENYIRYAVEDNLCVVTATLTLEDKPCDGSPGKVPATATLTDRAFYDSLIDAWSMRNWDPKRISGHDQFFDAFGRFGPAFDLNQGEVIADVLAQAARDNVSYVELMFGLDNGKASDLGEQVGWDTDFGRLRDRLMAAGMPNVVAAARQNLDVINARIRERLRCNTPTPEPGCAVTVR